MKFFSNILSKNIWLIRAISREVVLCLIIIVFPIFFPQTANAGLFSLFSSAVSDQVSAKAPDTADIPNSQNMGLLKAAVNIDPNPNKLDQGPMISGNALLAEIGPSGTISDIDDDPTNTQISIYTVRSGDSLSKIAKMFDVSVNTIIWANNLGSTPTIHEGDTLIILPISGIKYSVKSGDTIKGIVSKYKADLDDVLKYNNITIDSKLSIGDIIIIPDAEPTAAAPVKSSTKSSVSSSKVYVDGSNPLHDADGPSYPGYYIRPIKGGVKTQGLHGYNAVDLADAYGTPIYAAADGTVIASMTNGAWNGGYGNYVIISHDNGTQTLYAHTSKNLVVRGQHVEQGQVIAKIGQTGHATGPHVHFEIRGAKNPF